MTEKIIFYEAMIAAFGLLAYADGEVHPMEVTHIMSFLKSRNIETDIVKIQSDIRDLTEHLDRNFNITKKEAFKKLERIKDDSRSSQALLEMLQSTIVSDQKIVNVEESVLAQILHHVDITEHVQ